MHKLLIFCVKFQNTNIYGKLQFVISNFKFQMGSCITKLTLSPDVELTLKAHPDVNHLLSLQLHYNSYDKQSQKIIDNCTQLALTNNLNLQAEQI